MFSNAKDLPEKWINIEEDNHGQTSRIPGGFHLITYDVKEDLAGVDGVEQLTHVVLFGGEATSET